MGLIASKKIYLLAEVECVKFNTNALNEMLKRVQHDKIKGVIPNLFRNLKTLNLIQAMTINQLHLYS